MPLKLERLRKLLTKPPQKAPNRQPQCGLILPVELWLVIIPLFKSKADLLALCRTSKAFRSLAQPYIYRSIDINIGNDTPIKGQLVLDERRLDTLNRAIQDPQFSGAVIEFRVRLAWCQDLPWATPSPCNCDRIDKRIGQILERLTNLQILHFVCGRCMSQSDVHHPYLEKLPTTHLQEMHLQCECFRFNYNILRQIFAASYVQTVRVLRWDPSGKRTTLSHLLDSPPMLGQDALPLVKELMCQDIGMFSPLLKRGMITHLACEDREGNLPNIISQSRTRLIHLRTKNTDCIVSSIEHDRSPYRNLRHIGGFTFTMREPELIIPYMKRLVGIPRLESVELLLRNMHKTLKTMDWVFPELHPYENPKDNSLARDLAIYIINLRKVYIRTELSGGDGYCQIWELSDEWHGGIVEEFRPWDILQGRI